MSWTNKNSNGYTNGTSNEKLASNGNIGCFYGPSTSGAVSPRPESSKIPTSNGDRLQNSSVFKHPGAYSNSTEANYGQNVGATQKTILNSVVQFIPAKHGFEINSEKYHQKYYVISTVVNSNGAVIEDQHSNGIVDPPETAVSPKLLNGFIGNANKSQADNSSTTSGIPLPQFEIYPADRIRIQWDQKFRCSTMIGLINMGNTCFINSVLQILTNTAPFANYLLSNEHDNRSCSISNCALCLMSRHILRVFNHPANGPDSFSPTYVVDRIKYFMKSHHVGRQEDAHEFLRYFIDAMQTAALLPYKDQKLDLFTKETTVISRIFGGYHKNEIICNICHSNSVTYDPFLDLSVEIKQSQGLEAALRHYTCSETLANDNAYLCLKCNRRVTAKKTLTIHQAPNVLTIQFKRFDHIGKIDRLITYPERLDLRPYMTEKTGQSVIYKLYGVIVHVGRTTHSGHYFAFTKNPIDQWQLLDDNRVSVVPATNALRNPTAYLLFYVRVSTPAVSSVKPQPKVPTDFIGPSKPPADVNGLHLRFKPTFSNNQPSAVSILTISAPAARQFCQPLSKPSTSSQYLPAVRNQPLKFRLNPPKNLINHKNGESSNATGQGHAFTTASNQRQAKVPLKMAPITKPVQDNSVSSSAKLVPYDDDSSIDSPKADEDAVRNKDVDTDPNIETTMDMDISVAVPNGIINDPSILNCEPSTNTPSKITEANISAETRSVNGNPEYGASQPSANVANTPYLPAPEIPIKVKSNGVHGDYSKEDAAVVQNGNGNSSDETKDHHLDTSDREKKPSGDGRDRERRSRSRDGRDRRTEGNKKREHSSNGSSSNKRRRHRSPSIESDESRHRKRRRSTSREDERHRSNGRRSRSRSRDRSRHRHHKHNHGNYHHRHHYEKHTPEKVRNGRDHSYKDRHSGKKN